LEIRQEHIFTVSQVTQEIKGLLEGHFSELWVEGEVSNVRIPPSGHIYFTLKDEWSQIRAVIFRGQAGLLRFIPEDGLHVICHGGISVYEPRGEYQLILDSVEPKGVGALQVAFEQLKNRLDAEGFFDAEHKKSLPLLPGRIGIVTSPSGAAIRDMLQIIHRRFPNVEIVIYPVRVQGIESPPEIAQAIRDLNDRGEVEVIIVGRGGGSLEDLWAFNDERVAKAIFESRIPIVSAVGHETDFTIADFVADMRAPTPSAAAELVVREKTQLLRSIQSLNLRMIRSMERQVEFLWEKLGQGRRGLVDPRRRMERFWERLDDLSRRLSSGGNWLVVASRNRTDTLRGSLLFRNPLQKVEGYGVTVSHLNKELSGAVQRALHERSNRVGKLLSGLDNLSPLSILKRGYSITRKFPSNEIVKEAHAVARGERVKVKLYRGELLCGVEESDLP